MKWVPAGKNSKNRTNMWHMMNKHTDRFLMDFPDCENLHLVFRGLSKEEPKNYKISVIKDTSNVPNNK